MIVCQINTFFSPYMPMHSKSVIRQVFFVFVFLWKRICCMFDDLSVEVKTMREKRERTVSFQLRNICEILDLIEVVASYLQA